MSVDDRAGRSVETRTAFENSGERVDAVFRSAPLKPAFYGPRLLLAHDLPRGLLGALGPFDVVFMDPPQHGAARESLLYDAFPALVKRGYAIVDDANGVNAPVIEQWKRAYGEAVNAVVLEGIGNGLGVIEKLAEAEPRTGFDGAFSAAALTLRQWRGERR